MFMGAPALGARQPKAKKLKKAVVVLSEETIAPGVRYTKYSMRGKIVHAVVMDRTSRDVAPRVIKAKDHATGRERLTEMAARYEQNSGNEVLALINANFWASGRNSPIGPCVIDGEVVEMVPYKNWSSAFFDKDNKLFIDTFRILGYASVAGQSFPIASTNRRVSATDVVMYNAFGGGTVPFVSTETIEQAVADAMLERTMLGSDSTEASIDSVSLRNDIIRAKREASAEHSSLKIACRYIAQPAINRAYACVVVAIDTGTVEIPTRGCILSFPFDSAAVDLSARIHPGDTIRLDFSTNVYRNTRFMNAVCGTPRLIRNGKAKHEAGREGVTSRRFITNALARSALGTDRNGNRLIIVAVEPARNGGGKRGATLADLSKILRLLGAYNAINLDGGGSVGLVVRNNHVFYDTADPRTRPVSVGLGFVRIGNVLRQYRR